MNREIEEMAKDLAYSIVWDDEDIMTVDGYKTALALRGKGYRRATDVAREIFAEIDKIALMHIDRYGRLLIHSDEYAELRKKYESEGEE